MFISYKENKSSSKRKSLYFNKNIIATNIRGSNDLLKDGSGFLANNLDEMIEKIIEIKNKKVKLATSDITQYKLDNVISEVEEILNNYISIK